MCHRQTPIHSTTMSSEQSSKLGIHIKSESVSCISQADDAVLLSNSIIDLNNLFHLTKSYCSKYDVELVPEKLKLLAIGGDRCKDDIEYAKLISRIAMNDNAIPFSQEAEHLGVIRASSGSNLQHIFSRISAHRGKLHTLLPIGMALNHNASVSASLKVEKMYALPVLMSDLPALVLTTYEIRILHNHYKNVLRMLLKLPARTPETAIYFLAGSMPFEAYLHLRQLSLFGMVCHKTGNILQNIGKIILTELKSSALSWFQKIRSYCIMYDLPHPLALLETPIPKLRFKSLCKQKVHIYWRKKLSNSLSELPSLAFIQPHYLSLQHAHPLWSSLDSNPYHAKAARTQSLFLTGRYKSERFTRFCSNNPQGYCLLNSCKDLKQFDDYLHILLRCPDMSAERRRLDIFISNFVAAKPVVKMIVAEFFSS